MEAEIQQPWLSMDCNAYLARRMYGVPNPLFPIVYFFFNLRVFIKEFPQQEEQETLRSKDTQFAAVELPKCLEGLLISNPRYIF